MRGDPWNEQRSSLLSKLWARGCDRERHRRTARRAVALRGAGKDLSPAARSGATRTSESASSKEIGSAGRRRRRRPHKSLAPNAHRRRRARTLLELTNDCCRWPHGGPGTALVFLLRRAGSRSRTRHALLRAPCAQIAYPDCGQLRPRTIPRRRRSAGFPPAMSRARLHRVPSMAIIDSPRLVPAARGRDRR